MGGGHNLEKKIEIFRKILCIGGLDAFNRFILMRKLDQNYFMPLYAYCDREKRFFIFATKISKINKWWDIY